MPCNIINRSITIKIQHLKTLVELTQNNFHVSDTAKKLHISQPAISKHIKLLEEELGVQLFNRSGKSLMSLTPLGKKVHNIAKDICKNLTDIEFIVAQEIQPKIGVLNVATNHTQLKYILPDVILQFTKKFPNVTINFLQGTPQQLSDWLHNDQCDFAIITENTFLHESTLTFPCYKWHHSIILPSNHELTKLSSISLEHISKYPLITYNFGFNDTSILERSFFEQKLIPNIILTAGDTDIIKTYVKNGLGIGIIADMAYNSDKGLVKICGKNLFPFSTTKIAIKKSSFVKDFTFYFIELFNSKLNKNLVQKLIYTGNQSDIDSMFDNRTLDVK